MKDERNEGTENQALRGSRVPALRLRTPELKIFGAGEGPVTTSPALAEIVKSLPQAVYTKAEGK